MADTTLTPLESDHGSYDSSELEEIPYTTKRIHDAIKRVYGRLSNSVHPDPTEKDFARIIVARGGLPNLMITKMNFWHKTHPDEPINYGPTWPAGVHRPGSRSDAGQQPICLPSVANHDLTVSCRVSEPLPATPSCPTGSVDNSTCQSRFELGKCTSRESSPQTSNIHILTTTALQISARGEVNDKSNESLPFAELLTKDQRTQSQALITQLDADVDGIENGSFGQDRWMSKLRSWKRKLEVEKIETDQRLMTGERRLTRLQVRNQVIRDHEKRNEQANWQVWSDGTGHYDDPDPSTLIAKSKPHSKTGNRAGKRRRISNTEILPLEVAELAYRAPILAGQTQANIDGTLEQMPSAKTNEDFTAIENNKKIKFNLKIKEAVRSNDGDSEKDFLQQEIAILRSDNRLLSQQLEHSKEREKTVLDAAEKVIERSACDKIEAIEQAIDNAINFSLSLEDHTTSGGDQLLAFLQQSIQKKLKKVEECRYNIQAAAA